MPSKSKKDEIRLIAVVADLHFGSTKALLPPNFRTVEGNKLILNLFQEWLWECWERSMFWLDAEVGDDPFALVVNGDLIEGCHHGTKEIISPDIADHSAAAIEVLHPLAELADATFIIRGTEAHTNNHEHLIGKAIGARLNEELGIHVFDRLTANVNGLRHVFRHHIGTSVRRGLAATQLGVNLAEEQLEAINNGEEMPRVVCCAHRHKFGKYEDDNGLIITSPPWQALTRFGHRVVSQARTKPGLFLLDYRGRKIGSLPEVRSKLFDCPQPKTVDL